jgi:hypothetical protein
MVRYLVVAVNAGGRSGAEMPTKFVARGSWRRYRPAVPRDMLIGRSGERLQGRILNAAFHIVTPFGPLTVPSGRISYIHFQVAGSPTRDEIHLKNVDVLGGKVRDETVDFRADTGEALAIPRAAVLLALFDWRLTGLARPFRAVARPLGQRRRASHRSTGRPSARRPKNTKK